MRPVWHDLLSGNPCWLLVVSTFFLKYQQHMLKKIWAFVQEWHRAQQFIIICNLYLFSNTVYTSAAKTLLKECRGRCSKIFFLSFLFKIRMNFLVLIKVSWLYKTSIRVSWVNGIWEFSVLSSQFSYKYTKFFKIKHFLKIKMIFLSSDKFILKIPQILPTTIRYKFFSSLYSLIISGREGMNSSK